MRSRNAISRSHFVSKECWTGLISVFQSLWAAMNFSVRGLKCPPSVKMRIAVLTDALAYVFGRNAMYWYRIYLSLGRASIVGTTIKFSFRTSKCNMY